MKKKLLALADYVITRTDSLLLLLVVLLGGLLQVVEPKPLVRMRDNLFDQYQRWMPREYQSTPVRIIDIDEESLRRVGQWPWARTQIAKMIDNLRDAGVSVIGLDMVLSEPDRTSPRSVSRVWRQVGQASPELLREVDRLPDHDEWLAQNLAKNGNVVLGLTLLVDAPREGMAIPLLNPAPYARREPFAPANVRSYDGVSPSLLPLQKAAAGNGTMNFNPDDDGVVRRVPLVLRYGDTLVPSLSAEMLRVAHGGGQPPVIVGGAKTGIDGAGMQALRIGRYQIPTEVNGEAWVHFTRPVSMRSIPAWQALQGELPANSLKGQMALIGSSALGLMDLRVSPHGQIIPGVEAHAQLLEQVLLNQVPTRPEWTLAVEVLFMLVVSFAVGQLALRARSLMAASLTALTVMAVFAAGWMMFAQWRLLLNPLTPSFIIIVSWLTGSLIHHARSERQQRWLTTAFSRYISPNKVHFLVNNPDRLELGGKRQACSFIFTDLQGFTTLMEDMDPALAVSALNTYLDGMVAITFKHEGTLDRIMGDAVAVVFSAPVEQPDHAQRAMDCAMEMAEFARRYAADLKARGVPFGNTRIGVHCGEVIVGNFGGSHLFDYRALGDPVNTAARLESVNKHLGTLFCVSAAVVSGCDRLPTLRPVGHLVLKGKSRPLLVYEPLLADDVASRAPLAEYEAAYRLVVDTQATAHTPPSATEAARYRAELALAALQQQHPKDPLVNLHLRRLQAGELGDTMVMSEK